MVLVDANVLIDVLTGDPGWADWSAAQLIEAVESDTLAVNPIIYAEVAVAYKTVRTFECALSAWPLTRLTLPYDAAWPAGQAFLRYRREGGKRLAPMPYFYIGAHALVEGHVLLTRDASRYRTYFPKVTLISP
jgi:predicted nucleic acid-binding protein